MSIYKNYKLVTLDQRFIAETIARTGSEQLLDKLTRSYVGLYDNQESWYLPLRANIGKNKPPGAFFETPFPTDNPHFKRPGIDFEQYVLKLENISKKSPSYRFSTVPLFPDGMEKIKQITSKEREETMVNELKIQASNEEIIELTEGPLAPVACLKPDAEVCGRMKDCITLPLWRKYDALIHDFFFQITLEDLINGKI